MMTVVHDDDVARRDALREAAGERVRFPAPVEVPVPKSPAPSDQPIVNPRETFVHRAAAPPRMRAEKTARTLTGQRLDAIRLAAEQSGELLGLLEHQGAGVGVERNGVSFGIG